MICMSSSGNDPGPDWVGFMKRWKVTLCYIAIILTVDTIVNVVIAVKGT